MTRPTCVKILLILGLPLGIASAACGQDAMGAGNALDANLSRTGGRANTPVQRTSYGARNLLVTGNVAGGRGFRESVGYLAADDFRGELGSNDLYEFLANSAISSIQLINYGNTYQRFRLGQQMDMFEYRRAGYGTSGGDITPYVGTYGQMNEIRANLDRVSRASASDSMLARDVEASIIGNAVTYDETGTQESRYLINASSMRGIYAINERQYVQGLGLNSYDFAHLLKDREAEAPQRHAGEAFDGRFVDLARDPGRIEGDMAQTRVDMEREPDYRAIMERIAVRYAQADQFDVDIEEGVLQQLDIDFEKLRLELMAGEGAEARAQEGEEDGQGAPSTATGEDGLPGLPPSAVRPTGAAGEGDAEDSERMSPEELGRLLRHGMKVHTLSPSEEDRLSNLIATGEKYLREGEFFWAERAFERALLFAPDHPLALAGMGHSEIGAGLYLSASLTLRKLFTRHPEMIDTSYDEGLLPGRERALAAVEKLRRRMDTEPTYVASNGFLLAYLGRHLEDRGLIETGLDLMAENAPGDPLLPLLQQVWLAPDDTGDAPDEASADDKPDSEADGPEADESAAIGEPEK